MADAHPVEPGLQHQFESMEQQKEASSLGMWIFLVTEILFFGGLFLAYTIYRQRFHGVFAEASGHLNVKLGALNTAVLIASSLTMALAIWSAQAVASRPAPRMLNTRAWIQPTGGGRTKTIS